jgi:hypothetical protein
MTTIVLPTIVVLMGIIGYAVTTVIYMSEPFTIIGVGFIVAFIVFRVVRGMAATKKVLNILHARYTYELLHPDEQKDVQQIAVMILSRESGCGVDHAISWHERLEPSSRFSLYALAMAEANIQPMTNMPHWMFVGRPLTLSKREMRELESQKYFFEKKYHVSYTDL